MQVHWAKSNKKNLKKASGALAAWHREGQAHFIIMIGYDVVYIITLDG